MSEAEARADTARPVEPPDSEAQFVAEHRRCGTPNGFDGCYAHFAIDHCRADGMAWPCDVHILAALSRKPKPTQAAADARAQIERDAVKPWREALTIAFSAEGHKGTCDVVTGQSLYRCSCGWSAKRDEARALLHSDTESAK